MTQFTLSAFADEASPEFDRQIAALHRKHIPLMEIRGVDGKGILDLTDEELDVVEKKLAAGNIGISAIGSPIGKIGIEDAHSHVQLLYSGGQKSGDLSRYRDRANTENGGLRRSKWRTLLPRE